MSNQKLRCPERRPFSLRALIAFQLLTVFGCGCQTTATLQRTALSAYDSGRPQDAIEALQQASEKRNAESEILQADLAIAELMSGQPKNAEQHLKRVQEKLDYLRQKDLSEQTLAVLSDGRSISYSGRDFENLMIGNLLTLSSLVSDRQDAFAFSRLSVELAEADYRELLPEPTATADNEFVTVSHQAVPAPMGSPRQSPHALATYLHSLIQSESAMDRQAAASNLTKLATWSTPETPVDQATFGTLTPPGHGGLHVITLTDRITDWIPENAVPTTGALLLADQILSAAGDYDLPPTVAPVKIAQPACRASNNRSLTTVRWQLNQPAVSSIRLLDLNAAAFDSYQADRDKKLAQAVARRIVKKTAVYTAKDQISVEGGSEVDTLLSIGGVIWEALEKADTRHLAFLPAQVEVATATLPEGQHKIQLSTTTDNRSVNAGASIPVTIQNGRNTVVLCFRNGSQFVGNVLVDGKAIEML